MGRFTEAQIFLKVEKGMDTCRNVAGSGGDWKALG